MVVEEYTCASSILCGDELHLTQHPQRPQRDIFEIADRRRHDVQYPQHCWLLAGPGLSMLSWSAAYSRPHQHHCRLPPTFRHLQSRDLAPTRPLGSRDSGSAAVMPSGQGGGPPCDVRPAPAKGRWRDLTFGSRYDGLTHRRKMEGSGCCYWCIECSDILQAPRSLLLGGTRGRSHDAANRAASG